MHKDQLTVDRIANFNLVKICNMVYKIEEIIKTTSKKTNQRNITQSEIEKILMIGGKDVGGLLHIESRVFNHALGYYFEEKEYQNYHVGELHNCLEIYLEHDEKANLKRKRYGE